MKYTWLSTQLTAVYVIWSIGRNITEVKKYQLQWMAKNLLEGDVAQSEKNFTEQIKLLCAQTYILEYLLVNTGIIGHLLILLLFQNEKITCL